MLKYRISDVVEYSRHGTAAMSLAPVSRIYNEDDFLSNVVIIFDANILRVIAERFPE